jgi:ubiquinone/menaquinone biosynthesis C-methylase UbiE
VNERLTILPEQAASRAFDHQSADFDRIYGNDTIIRYKRERVREHVGRYLQSPSSILELNAGTGEDAIWFASAGHTVHATDISAGMLEQLDKKRRQFGFGERINFERCSFTQLEGLANRGPFDMVFSNFAGLNCSNQLAAVLESSSALLKPGGLMTLVILPKFCLWEFLLLFKGKFKTAFRRFSGMKGTKAKIEDKEFRCWYYNPSFIKKRMKKQFEVLAVEGLCSIVPPSYITGFAEKRPGLFSQLVKKENKLKAKWPWRSVGDYYIITLRKKVVPDAGRG